ncbi:hypothetical protein J7F01_04150 [Streptomyces sp. ISL-22]|nr:MULTISPECIES: hypothetical protein [Streptomyces]MBT2418783.1 hypothetical protein [Streptomyces sp. ISL-24]MBT2431408.1 hypothetical protein [Streptomyces sp. ISL-22]
MQISRSAKKAAMAVAMLGAVAGAAPAYADAGEDVTSRLNHHTNPDIHISYAYSLQSAGNKNVAVRDERADDSAVYSEFDRKNTKGLRLWNKKGKGETTYSDSSTSNYVVKVTACVHYDLTPDKCGPDDRPGDGR